MSRGLFTTLLLGLGLTIGLTACTDEVKEDTAEDTGQDTGQDTGPAEPEGTEHCGEISEDETWTAEGNPHRVTCDIDVLEATLTIGEGVRVLVAEGTRFDIADNDVPGSLKIEGSADRPVVLRPDVGEEVSGTWDGVRVLGLATDVSIRHAQFFGGGDPEESNLTVRNAEVLLDNVLLSGSNGYGLLLGTGASLHPDSTALTITGAGDWAVVVDGDQAHTLPAEGSSYTGNGQDGIAMQAGDLLIPATWEPLGVPYVAEGHVTMEGTSGAPATLTIEAGVTVLFGEGRSLRFSRSRGASGLRAGSLDGDPVVFSSLGAEEPGYWSGLQAFEGTEEFVLRNAVVQWAGNADNRAVIYAEEGVEVSLQQVEVRGGFDHGIRLYRGAHFSEDSADITIRDCMDMPVVVGADQVHTVPVEDYAGNGRDAIGVEGEEVPESVTWRHLGLPYVVSGSVRMEGIAVAPAVLTIDPEVTLLFEQNSSIQLSSRSGASGLLVNGEPGREVLMSSATSPVHRAWTGIAAHAGTESGSFELHHTVIEWAGDDGFESVLYVEDADVLIDNVTIRDSAVSGFFLGNDSSFLNASEGLVVEDCWAPGWVSANQVSSVPTDSVLTGNERDFLHVHMEAQVTASANWPTYDVPYWINGILRVGDPFNTPVTLTLSPGTVFHMANGTQILVGDERFGGDGGLRARGTASEPIIFTAAEAFQPGAWEGLRVGERCDTTTTILEHVQLGYGGGDQGNIYGRECPLTISDTLVHDSLGAGLYMDRAALTATRLTVEDSNEHGILLRNTPANLDELTVRRSQLEGVYVTRAGSTVSINNNSVIEDNLADGVFVNNGELTLDGVTVQGNGNNGVAFMVDTSDDSHTIRNSAVDNNSRSGVYFLGDGDGVSLSGVQAHGNVAYGVECGTNSLPPSTSAMSYSSNGLGGTSCQ